MTDGRPYDFINMAFKAELLLAGYAVISMDFRGTGMSLSFALETSNYNLTTAMLPQLYCRESDSGHINAFTRSLC